MWGVYALLNRPLETLKIGPADLIVKTLVFHRLGDLGKAKGGKVEKKNYVELFTSSTPTKSQSKSKTSSGLPHEKWLHKDKIELKGKLQNQT